MYVLRSSLASTKSFVLQLYAGWSKASIRRSATMREWRPLPFGKGWMRTRSQWKRIVISSQIFLSATLQCDSCSSVLSKRLGTQSSFALYALPTSTIGPFDFGSWGSYSTIRIVALVVWLAVLVLLAGGLVRSFIGSKKVDVLKVGGAVSAIAAVVWGIAIASLNSTLASSLTGAGADAGGTLVEYGVGKIDPTGLLSGTLGNLGEEGLQSLLGQATSGLSLFTVSYGAVITGVAGALVFVFLMLEARS